MAKRFRFRLETVERVRKRERDQCRRVVADAAREVVGVRRRIEELHRQRESLQADNRHDLCQGTLDMKWMREQLLYRNTLDRLMEDAHSTLRQRQSALADARGNLVRADQRYKAIEKLHARRRAEYDAAMTKAQRAELDEIATQRYRPGDMHVAAGVAGRLETARR